MTFATLLGIILGAGLVWYKGLYGGPWTTILYTIGLTTVITVVAYYILKMLAGAAGFFFKLLIIAAILIACYFGGQKALDAVHTENQQVQSAK